jgi:hypothetical protein
LLKIQWIIILIFKKGIEENDGVRDSPDPCSIENMSESEEKYEKVRLLIKKFTTE